MSVTGGDAQEMVVGLSLEDMMTPALQAASNMFISFTGSVERSLAALGRLGVAAAPLTLLVGAMAQGVTAAAELEQRIANLNAVMDITPRQMQAITQSAMNMSRSTQFNTAPILQGEAQLGKAGAGFQGAQQETPDVLNLASATFSQPVDAANAFIAAQKDFHLGITDSKQIADTLTQAVDSSTVALGQFRTALGQIGPVASANNQDLRGTLATLADLTENGLTANAGTALKTFTQRIVTETPAARAEINKLGLEFYDATGKLKSYADIADELRTKTLGMTDEAKQQALGTIFGTRGIQAADIFSTEGSQGITDVTGHMDSLGSSADIAAKKLDTLQGQAHILASSLNVLAVEGGNTVLPMIRSFADEATSLTNVLSNIPATALTMILGAGAIGGLSKLQSGFSDRRDERLAAAAQPGIDRANASAASLAQQQAAEEAAQRAFSEKMAQLEFTADSQIVAAHQKMVAELDALDDAHNAKALAAFAQQAAKIQALQDAMAISAQEASAKQSVTFDKQFAMLGLNQAEQQDRLTLQQTSGGFSPATQLDREQKLEQTYLAEKQQLTTAYDAKYTEIEEASASRRIAAINKAGDAELAALRERATMQRTAIAQANATSVMGAEAQFANQAAGAENALYTAEAAAGGKGLYGANGAAATQRLAQGTASSIDKKGVGAAIGGLLGEIAIPLLIGFTVKTMVFDPVAKAITDEIDKRSLEFSQAQFNQSAHPGPGNSVQTTDQGGGNIFSRFKNWLGDSAFGTGVKQDYSNPFVFDPAGAQQQIDMQRQIDEMFKKDPNKDPALQWMQQQLKTWNDARQLVPAQARQALNDYASVIVEGINAGSINAQQATAAYQQNIDKFIQMTARFMPNGVRDDVMQIVRQSQKNFGATATDTYNQKLRSDTAEAQQNDLNYNRVGQLRNEGQALGYSLPDDNTLLNGIVGTDKDTALEIKRIDDAYKELTKDLSDLGNVVGKIDLTKGLSSLGDSSKGLDQAAAALGKLGVTSATLGDLQSLAKGFKGIQDAEEQATSAYNAYLMTLSDTDNRVKALDSLGKRFQDENNQIAMKSASGQALSPDEQRFADTYLNTMGEINRQKQQLGTNAGTDLLGIAQHLPDYTKVDDMERGWVKDMGGNQSLFHRSKTDAEQIQKMLESFTNQTYTVKIDFVNANGNPVASPAAPSGGNGVTGSLVDVGKTLAGTTALPDWLKKGLGFGGAMGFGGAPEAGGGRGFAPINYADYSKVLSGYPGSPIADQGSFDTLEQVAQQTGIDPRLLMSVMQTESQYGSKAGKIGKGFNYGGMGMNDRGFAHSSGISATDGGPSDYAAYNNYGDFLRDIAGWIQQNGSSFSNYQTADQGQGKGSAYTDLQKSVPTSGGTSGTAPLDSTRQQIVQAAMSYVGQDAFVEFCEKFVETVTKQADGIFGATGINERNATTAFSDAQSKGLEVSKDQAQPGDIVYYPDFSGPQNPNDASVHAGHTAIYAGGGKQISTYDGRPTPNGDPNAIHVEPVADNAKYVRIPGLPTGAGAYDEFGHPLGGNPLTVNGTQSAPATATYAQAGAQLQQFLAALSGLNPTNQSLMAGQFDKNFALNQQQNDKLYGSGFASNEKSIQQSLAATAAWGAAMKDVQNGTAITAEHMQAIRDTGGPIGAALVAEAQATQALAVATAKVKDDQQQLKDAATAYAGIQRQRRDADQETQADRRVADLKTQADDRTTSRGQTTDDWRLQDKRFNDEQANQSAHNRIQQETNAEDVLWTVKSRQYDDTVRLIDREGTVRQRQLSDEMLAMDRQHQAALNHTGAQEQQLLAQSRMASVTGGGNSAAVQLAMIRQNEKPLADQFDIAKQKMQDQVTLEQRYADDVKYNLENQHIVDQHNHEDRQRAIQLESQAQSILEQRQQNQYHEQDTAIQRNRTLLQWQQEDARTQTELTRQAIDDAEAKRRQKEDDNYQAWVTNKNEELTTDQTIAQQAKEGLTAIQTIEQTFQKIYPILGEAATVLFNLFDSAKSLGTSANGDLHGTAPVAGGKGDTPPTKHAMGTRYAGRGLALVGEREPELLDLNGGERIYNPDQIRQMFAPNVTPISAAPSYGGGGDVHVHVAGDLDGEGIANVKAYIKSEIKASEKRMSADVARRSQGGMR